MRQFTTRYAKGHGLTPKHPALDEHLDWLITKKLWHKLQTDAYNILESYYGEEDEL